MLAPPDTADGADGDSAAIVQKAERTDANPFVARIVPTRTAVRRVSLQIAKPGATLRLACELWRRADWRAAT